MSKCMAAAGVLILAVSMTGCGASGGGSAPLEQVVVSGTVNLDGKPLAEGTIVFTEPGSGGAPIPIKDGKFEGKAGVGEKRVEIQSLKAGEPVKMGDQEMPTEVNIIPARFNTETTLKATVDASGATGLKFDVESK